MYALSTEDDQERHREETILELCIGRPESAGTGEGRIRFTFFFTFSPLLSV
jgi:hypothetical protein